MAAIGTRIDRIFKKAAEEAAAMGVSINEISPDCIFSFDDYPQTRKQIQRLMIALHKSMEGIIVDGVRSAWTLSNNKNNALAQRVFGRNTGKLTKEEYRRYFSNNDDALAAFIDRKNQGLGLSDRVWRYTQSFKAEIELGLDLGIRSGQSAAQLSRDLQQYLQHPDKLFRRVRNEHGNLMLSKAAKAYHPGIGVYRSSYKNARRLAVTETNMAYHSADYLRWQQMDFITGIRIELSGNHTCIGADGRPRLLHDICDNLTGTYPKEFKFTGWHPHCRCHAIPILKTEEEVAADIQRILAGDKPETDSVNTVRDVPAAFREWVEGNAGRIERGMSKGALPYFIKDNLDYVNDILRFSGHPAFATVVKVGDKEYLLKDLIAECRIEPTENGRIYVHPEHGKGEVSENLNVARWRAEQFGEEVVLLPNPQGVKSADSYNITRGVQEEYKRGRTASVNAIDRLLRDGAKQADYVILEIDCDITPGKVEHALQGRLKRCDISEVRLKIGDKEALYSREYVLKDGFKIRPEDFHDVSAFRNGGSTLEKGVEPNIVTNADAKLAKFFGLNKKTPQEIAIERHAKRNAVTIQQAWNDRRITNVGKAVQDGFLPKECLTGLSALRQEEFNARIAFLQKTAARHAARTPQDIDEIKKAWEAKQKRDATTKLMANNVLKLHSEYPLDVDFSTLEKLIADNNLTKMREEARSVAQAIKAVRADYKTMSAYLDNVHEWHKTFTLAELKPVYYAVDDKMMKWELQGIEMTTNAEKLKSKLEFEIQWLEKHKKHSTWQVAQDAYKKKLAEVETHIELTKLNAEYTALLGFKTMSKDFKDFMAKAKAAIDAKDPKTAKLYLNNAQWKKDSLEARRKGGKVSGGMTFAEMTKEQVHNLLLEYETNTVRGVDKELRAWMESEWGNLTYEEQKLLTRYTQAYSYLNDRLRGIPPSSWIPQSEYDHDMPIITQALNKLKVPRDMVVRRGTGNYEIKAIGKWLSEVEEGDVFTEPAFLSTAAHRDKGFFKSLEMVIVVPKGARGAFAEPFSHYNDSCSAYDYDNDRIWDGKTKQSIEDEFEWIGQRGCQFKVLQKTGNRIILQLIGQMK